MGLDEAWDHQPPVERFVRRLGGDARSDIGDAAGRDADVDELLAPFGKARLAQDQIERHRCYCAASLRPR